MENVAIFQVTAIVEPRPKQNSLYGYNGREKEDTILSYFPYTRIKNDLHIF